MGNQLRTNKLIELAHNELKYAVKIRRIIHQNPELGFEEFKTSELITHELGGMGYEVIRSIGKTGVVALAGEDSSGPTLLLRFDMDALPIQEENEKPYKSQNDGVMHACGHDGHVAIGLTVAKIIAENKSKIKGTVKFLFQPAEEGLGGAQETIRDGVMENPKPDYVFGLHLWNEKPINWIGYNKRAVMAGSDRFEIKVIGKGGHGGVPHEAIDPIVAAAQVISSAQSIVARNISPIDSAVISFCHINGGSTHNVIPEHVMLHGTIRTFNKQTRFLILERLTEITQSVAEGYDCKAEVKFIEGTPPVINHEPVTQILRSTLNELFPESNIDDDYKTMGAEDFSLFLDQIPGCFYFIGSANQEKELNYGHHHPRFDFDEQAMAIGTASMLGLIEKMSCISLSDK